MFVSDDDGRVRVRRGDSQSLLAQKRDVLIHPPTRFVEAVLDRMADAREAFQLLRVEAEETGVGRRLDDERILEIDHIAPQPLSLGNYILDRPKRRATVF